MADVPLPFGLTMDELAAVFAKASDDPILAPIAESCRSVMELIGYEAPDSVTSWERDGLIESAKAKIAAGKWPNG